MVANSKWSILMKTKADEIKHESGNLENNTFSNDKPNQSGVYILSCIPVFGLLLSILVFVLVDLVAIIKRVILFRIIITEHVEKILYPNNCAQGVDLSPDDIETGKFCPLCLAHKIHVEFKEISDEELHMSSKHVKQYFINDIVTKGDLSALKFLCNLVVDSEISSTVADYQIRRMSGCDNTPSKLCRYLCKGGYRSLNMLKSHLVHFHRELFLEKIQALVELHENR